MKNQAKTPTIAFNFFYGPLRLIDEKYELKNPLSGWWKTYKPLDMDIQETLQPKSIVILYHSDKQNCYLACIEKDGVKWESEEMRIN